MNSFFNCQTDEFETSTFATVSIWGQPPAAIDNLGHSVSSGCHPTAKLTRAFLACQPIVQDLWQDTGVIGHYGFLARDYLHQNLFDIADQ